MRRGGPCRPSRCPGHGLSPSIGGTRSLRVGAALRRAGQGADPSFSLSPQNKRAVTEICGRLEGIPLAIELAAARVGTLSLDQISKRLGGSLDLLTRGGRTAEPQAADAQRSPGLEPRPALGAGEGPVSEALGLRGRLDPDDRGDGGVRRGRRGRRGTGPALRARGEVSGAGRRARGERSTLQDARAGKAVRQGEARGRGRRRGGPVPARRFLPRAGRESPTAVAGTRGQGVARTARKRARQHEGGALLRAGVRRGRAGLAAGRSPRDLLAHAQPLGRRKEVVGGGAGQGRQGPGGGQDQSPRGAVLVGLRPVGPRPRPSHSQGGHGAERRSRDRGQPRRLPADNVGGTGVGAGGLRNGAKSCSRRASGSAARPATGS